MLEDDANHLSLVRFIPDFVELDNLVNYAVLNMQENRFSD